MNSDTRVGETLKVDGASAHAAIRGSVRCTLSRAGVDVILKGTCSIVDVDS